MIPKFRAWDKSDNEMISVEDMSWDYRKNDELYFSGIGDGITFWKDADELEIMQSTGLKDKNGVEIFEGDIVRVDVPNQLMCGIYEVRRAKSGAWRIDNNIQGRELWLASPRDVEVIGNIYENPELLEGKNG